MMEWKERETNKPHNTETRYNSQPVVKWLTLKIIVFTGGLLLLFQWLNDFVKVRKTFFCWILGEYWSNCDSRFYVCGPRLMLVRDRFGIGVLSGRVLPSSNGLKLSVCTYCLYFFYSRRGGVWERFGTVVLLYEQARSTRVTYTKTFSQVLHDVSHMAALEKTEQTIVLE